MKVAPELREQFRADWANGVDIAEMRRKYGLGHNMVRKTARELGASRSEEYLSRIRALAIANIVRNNQARAHPPEIKPGDAPPPPTEFGYVRGMDIAAVYGSRRYGTCIEAIRDVGSTHAISRPDSMSAPSSLLRVA